MGMPRLNLSCSPSAKTLLAPRCHVRLLTTRRVEKYGEFCDKFIHCSESLRQLRRDSINETVEYSDPKTSFGIGQSTIFRQLIKMTLLLRYTSVFEFCFNSPQLANLSGFVDGVSEFVAIGGQVFKCRFQMLCGFQQISIFGLQVISYHNNQKADMVWYDPRLEIMKFKVSKLD